MAEKIFNAQLMQVAWIEEIDYSYHYEVDE